MITGQGELFDEILANPVIEGADKLLIVTGYASANMVARHVDYVRKILKRSFRLELIIGMAVKDGIELKNHKSFIQLQESKDLDFECNYIINPPAIHSKVYTWLKKEEPYKSFTGSANYTQNAFSTSQREAVAPSCPKLASDYFQNLLRESINCNDDFDIISSHIDFYESKRIIKEVHKYDDTNLLSYELEKVTLTLLDRSTGEVPNRSGLNWGQRPEYNRDPNQAYLNIPSDICRSGFFPDLRNVFTILTDDDKQLICVRAQQNGKGLHTTLNNALMGQYFRFRLCLGNGKKITLKDLLKYGRTDVDIYKIDEETYHLDFSV
ncbi:NgoFVII restriction endonuclease [Arcticibacter pallidicorallinus]|uniref:NgoFVII restriction endonuclease n=1 Tax=Arcticibacter pallidicorallinus TaxID=1259464 RepID=A0A2T0UC24_9SPHI|nr:restriction endonuclease PLD domain-containing protein [Arcticibacter pallidicorallinus]PRY55491.1 NgoFVII restriction endonuclease [Arcticibacter pallidicorallinus]